MRLPETQSFPVHAVHFLSIRFKGPTLLEMGRRMVVIKWSDNRWCSLYELYVEMLLAEESGALGMALKKSLIYLTKAETRILAARSFGEGEHSTRTYGKVFK